ncbi:MAG TPA: hypothetical protein VEK38_02510 [Candidatus Bathyarchaeia archaeon]|nr:hypothetical protein [Candidatus Bathyarchaeia archaeon]
MKQYIFFFIIAITSFFSLRTRSIHRKINPGTPCFSISWHNDTKIYVRYDTHFEAHPIFTAFDNSFFLSHLFACGPIDNTHDTHKNVDASQLSSHIEHLIGEIQQHKKYFTHFDVLQAKNFNYHHKCGLLVLKSKEYPFVVKLFIESPRTFLNPYIKGFEPVFSYYMSGGANRHMLGFTRIKNLEYIKTKIAADPAWSQQIKLPRKWYWIPDNCPWITIVGTNIGTHDTLTVTFPGTYALIADYIPPTSSSSFNWNTRSHAIIDLCNYLDMFIDPHATNYLFSPSSIPPYYTITIIDTEHFPSLLGLKEKVQFTGYIDWLVYLARKAFSDIYLQTKQSRKASVFNSSYPLALPFT